MNVSIATHEQTDCADRMLADVIGAPISHSKSPLIHGQWIRALSLNASFGASHVEPGQLEQWLISRRAGKSWRGCSVTAPLKQAVIPFLDRVSPEAKRLGAVNLIKHDGRKLIGFNTDIDGIHEALSPHVSIKQQVAIIGAGGAMRAALCYAIDEGFEDIRIVTRSPGRTFDSLASRFSAKFCITACETANRALDGANVIINATPLGSSYGAPMRPDILDGLSRAHAHAVVLDMVYDPAETQLLQFAARAKLIPVSGLAMLVGQARRAFALLFGCPPPSELPLDLGATDALF